MKTCPKCGAEVIENASFCTKCGEKLGEQEAPKEEGAQTQSSEQTNTNANTNANYTGYTYANPQNPYNGYTPPVDPYDHTAEFTAKDISDNKVIAMAAYILGIPGVIIAALLGSQSSPYAGFHVRQSVKLMVIETLLGIVAVVFFWTFIIPILALIAYAVLFVIRIICFFSVCNGQAKEPVIIRSLGFLR